MIYLKIDAVSVHLKGLPACLSWDGSGWSRFRDWFFSQEPCAFLRHRLWELDKVRADSGPGVYSIAIQTQWDSVHTGPGVWCTYGVA